MSRRVRTHSSFLELLQSTTVKQRKALLQTSTDEQLRALNEVIVNFYRGTISVSDHYIKKLFPYKTAMRRIVTERMTKKEKRTLLSRKQAMLPWILRPMMPMMKDDDATEDI